MGTKVVNQTCFTLLAGGASHFDKQTECRYYLGISSISKFGKVTISNLRTSLGYFSLEIPSEGDWENNILFQCLSQ